ncbi:MAG: hypothetical protein WBC92_10885 [Terracidiphilus sp.]
MKRCLVVAGLIFGFGLGLHAQVVDVKVCDVAKDPASFNGKMVRIKGTVVAGFDQFIIRDTTDPNCGYQVDGIWLSYPEGTKGKAGAAAVMVIQPARNFTGKYTPAARTPVTLQKDKDFKQFDSLLSQTHQKGADMCLGCTRYEVTATVVGRLDSVADASLKRDAAGKIVGFGGFGNMNAYPARLVLQSVTDVTPKEIDFTKNDEETKGDQMQSPGSSSDVSSAITMAQKLADALAASPAKDGAVKAAGVYGKSGEHTGVITSTGTTNDADIKAEEMGTKDSPDGVLFNCVFNSDRLQGDALTRAVVHLGQHVVDLRTPQAGNEVAPPFVLEYNAWVITTITAIAGRQKYLTLPGGYLVWDSTWPADARNDKMEGTLKDFLANEAQLSR